MEQNNIEEPAPVVPQPSKLDSRSRKPNLAYPVMILDLLTEDSIIHCYPIYGGGNPPPAIHGYFRAGKTHLKSLTKFQKCRKNVEIRLNASNSNIAVLNILFYP